MSLDEVSCHRIHGFLILDGDSIEVGLSGLKTDYRAGVIGSDEIEELVLHALYIE